MGILLPDRMVRRVTDLTADFLKSEGVSALFLDVDNTLSTHKGQVPIPGLQKWIREMKGAGIRLIILSNAQKKRLLPFASGLGLDFISLGCKPLPFGFRRAMRRLGVAGHRAAMVGDQLFTDILGGNLAGVTTFLVEPILPESGRSFRFRRRWEQKILKRYQSKG